jgi:hypothetical protein
MLDTGPPNPEPDQAPAGDAPSAPLVDAVMKRILERKGFGVGKTSARSAAPAPEAVPVAAAAPVPVAVPAPAPAPAAVAAPERAAPSAVLEVPPEDLEATDIPWHVPATITAPERAAPSAVLEVPPEDLEATDTPSHVPVQVLLPAPGDLVPTIERCNRCRVPVESKAHARQRGLCSDCLAVLPTFEPIKPPETAGLTPVPPPARVSTRRRANAASSHGSRTLERSAGGSSVIVFIVVGLAVAAILVYIASQAQAP